MLTSLKTLKAAYLPVLITYFAYGASGITSVARVAILNLLTDQSIWTLGKEFRWSISR